MAAERFTEEDLKKKGYAKDGAGVWTKPVGGVDAKRPVVAVPKVSFTEELQSSYRGINAGRKTYNIVGDRDYIPLRRLSLCLFGEPMPKQSVRSFVKNDKVMHYQPAEMKRRVADYQRQVREQLPPDFVAFQEIVHVRKLHFVFCPLKSFSKNKMDRIAAGEIFYKTTKPDLPDNLKKLVNDAMSGLVYKDDSLIVTENNVAKYYGTGGMILIEFEGR